MVVLVIVFISILLHELGHYLAAICCGISVRKFCIFFDPGFRMLSTGNRFKTEFCIGWLPFGGYVALKKPDSDALIPKDCILSRPLWQRLLFYSAGMLVNLIFAFVCFYSYTDKYLDPDDKYPIITKMGYSKDYLKKKSRQYYISLVHSFSDKEEKVKENGHNPKPDSHKRGLVSAIRNNSENLSFRHLLWETSLINLSLFLFNILPIPPLDGGFMCFNLYHLVTRREIGDNAQLAITGIGALILLGLSAYYFVLTIYQLIVT